MATCNKCGTVAFEVSRKRAERQVKTFNNYFDSLSEKDKEFFEGKSSKIEQYEHCKCGAHYSDFRNTKLEDFLKVSTINPIIKRNE